MPVGSVEVRVLAVVVLMVACGCGSDQSAASPTEVTTLDTAPVTTAATMVSPPSSGPVTTVAPSELPAVGFVAEDLARARALWSEAGIGSYQLTVTEHVNHWSAGCSWTSTVSGSVVTETVVDPPECVPVEWTVEQLHETVAGWVDDVQQFADPAFGEHTLMVGFDDVGVPVTMEFDLANGDDEERSMQVTVTPLP